MGLSSPNKMIWSCFRSLERNIKNIEEECDINTIKDIAATSIIMSVTTVETFINMYFRLLVEEEKYKHHKTMIMKDTISDNGNRVKGLKYKLNNWPNVILEKNINFENGIGNKFDRIRKTRNDLIHFTSTYEPLSIGNVIIKGLSNTDSFDNLKKEDAMNAFIVAKELIEHIIFLSGVSKKQTPHVTHQWTGLISKS